jgi:hypothetical protein
MLRDQLLPGTPHVVARSATLPETTRRVTHCFCTVTAAAYNLLGCRNLVAQEA